jgi:2-hydroxychromene-2-carboxylate isomerase
MKTLDFWFDPVSPFRLPGFHALARRARRTLLLRALSADRLRGAPQALGAERAGEIEPKRAWTFRQVHWLAHRHGIPLATPARHPFNPLALSRLAWACAPEGRTPGRHVCESVLRHVWDGGGADAEEPQRLEALRSRLGPAFRSGVRAGAPGPSHFDRGRHLPAASSECRPSASKIVCSGGFDALDMASGLLRGDAWFDAPDWQREGAPRPGVTR